MSEHYIRTGVALSGDEFVLVSEEYLDHCIPSTQESVLALVGGFFLGVSIALLPLSMLMPLWLIGSAVCVSVGVPLHMRHRRLRRERLGFLKCAEAKNAEAK